MDKVNIDKIAQVVSQVNFSLELKTCEFSAKDLNHFTVFSAVGIKKRNLGPSSPEYIELESSFF